ncbi:putative RNA recognition motif containing protein [Lyophyllum shimeji]|uniref:Probable RNA-binding protein 18 n=1 Tax=Lyophyllum shimeji TaxID=47721 RepID=A0A9P3PT39_LYOSH|nr:putative RNA recognition motif containing protein [Lyophyllum shimeji]
MDSLSIDQPSKSPSPQTNEHLSYPSTSTESTAEPSTAPAPRPRQLLKDRLYVGNLHPTVDEYTLLQIFSKFGKVTKLDFLFHKTGALKGKPRGYAFVEYGTNDEAAKALSMAHDKLLRGRKLVVTHAHQAPVEAGGAGASGVKRKSMMETGRPTTLSLLKTGAGTRHNETRDKIAMMEAKLRQMESTNPKPALIPGSSTSVRPDEASTPPPPTAGTLPHHASLPPKPPPPLPESLLALGQPKPKTTKPKTPLPSLPILPPSQSQSQSRLSLTTESAPAKSAKTTKLIGVKIKKPQVAPSDKG